MNRKHTGRPQAFGAPLIFLVVLAVAGPLVGLFQVLSVGRALAQDYGVPVDSYPAWQDRALEVVVNACRMGPTGFRDGYLQYPGILQPAYYPPVAPLVWCEELNHAARFHSEDMVSCDQLSHTSCDGTTMFDRIATFYPYSVYRGENVAAGLASPFAIVVLWVEDMGAADGSGLDGHRQNVMRTQHTEGGGGYAYGAATMYKHYWTYDFGGRDLGDPPALVDGAHLFIEADTTDFWANWYDPEGGEPQGARVYIDGERHDLTLRMGTTVAGTWTTGLPTATACRSYTFQFVDGDGTAHWYPASGALRTWNEGGCTEDYLAGSSGVPAAGRGRAVLESAAPNPFNPETTIRFRLTEPGDVRLTVVDVRGRLVRTLLVAPLGAGPHAAGWDGRDESGRMVGSGTYFARLCDGAGQEQVRKMTLVK